MLGICLFVNRIYADALDAIGGAFYAIGLIKEQS
jgi:hypothetical protein